MFCCFGVREFPNVASLIVREPVTPIRCRQVFSISEVPIDAILICTEFHDRNRTPKIKNQSMAGQLRSFTARSRTTGASSNTVNSGLALTTPVTISSNCKRISVAPEENPHLRTSQVPTTPIPNLPTWEDPPFWGLFCTAVTAILDP